MQLARLCPVSLALSLGCIEETWLDQYDSAWRGEFVTVYGYDLDIEQACGDSLSRTDSYVGALLDFHDSRVEVNIDYRWLSEAWWMDIVPCGDAPACNHAHDVFTRRLGDRHELTHAVRWHVRGSYCADFIEEGMAEYLEGPHGDLGEVPSNEVVISELLTSVALDGSNYDRAGHFIAFLMETYGLDAIQSICAVLPVENTIEDWDVATRAALDLSLDEVLAAYASYPLCTHHQYRARLTECAGEPDVVVSATEPTEFSFHLGCDDPDVLGQVDGTMMLTRRVQVEVPGTYAIEVDDGSPVYERAVVALHEQCAACSQQPLAAIIEDVEIATQGCTWFESPTECGDHELSGMHTFVFFLAEGLDRDVTVRLIPEDAP